MTERESERESPQLSLIPETRPETDVAIVSVDQIDYDLIGPAPDAAPPGVPSP